MFVIAVATICLGAYLLLELKVKNGKKYFCILTGAILFLYAALRGIDYTTDIQGYISSYQKYSTYSFQQILALYVSNIKNPSFYVVGWVLSRVFENPQWWLASIGAVYAFCGVYVIYKESENPLLSVIAWLSLGFFSFSLSGLRQTLALSLTMLAYFPAKNRKFWKFLILLILATLFHTSAFVFLLVYPIVDKKIGIGHAIIALTAVIIFVGFQGTVRSLIAFFFDDSYLGGYADRENALTFTGFIIQVAIFVFCMIYYPNVRKRYKNGDILYNLSFVGILFQLFSSMIAEMFRVSMYFSFFNVLLIPLAISTEPNKKMRWFLTTAILIIFFLNMFKNGVPVYEFFWQ